MRALLAVASTLLLLSGATSFGARHPAPFQADGGVSGGSGSGLWGDTFSGPSGDHLGCIPGRHYGSVITVSNRTKATVVIIGAGGAQPSAALIERVAVQIRLAPPPSNVDLLVVGYRGWSRDALAPLAVPPGRAAWVQSNFLMRDCSLLSPGKPTTVNREITLDYRVNGAAGEQRIAVPGARIVLTRATADQVQSYRRMGGEAG